MTPSPPSEFFTATRPVGVLFAGSGLRGALRIQRNTVRSEIEAKHFQFPMNSRRTPGSIFGDHAKDQVPQFPVYALSARSGGVP